LAAAYPASASPVVLISVDGMLPEYYQRPDELGLKTPNLRALTREGVRAVGAQSVMPSVTFPAHTTMVTGVHPNRHGINNNSIFDPDGSLGGGWHFYYDDVKVPTLFSRAREANLRAASVTWPVTAGAPVELNVPDMYPVPTLREAKNLVALIRTGGQPGMLAEVLPGPQGLMNMRDDVRARVAVRFAREKPDLLAVHFLELDEAQHKFGPRSAEALATVERIDALLGTLFDELRASGRWDATTVVLVSDHGFLPVSKQIHLSALLRTLGLLQFEAGNLLSWRAVASPASGSAGIVLHPRATPEDRRRVDDAVKLLLANPAYGVARALRGPELAATGGFAGAYVALEAQPGFMFVRGGEMLPLIAPSVGYMGAHGYDPRRPEMRASFVMRGPGIRRGKEVGVVRLIDVAPTIARVLGFDLGRVDGRVLSEIFEAERPLR
jgi:predicted AlkP superfamily pyrophosphatase or phosphodiesterase